MRRVDGPVKLLLAEQTYFAPWTASVGTDPPDEFDVVPQIYDKKIPVPLRRQAVRQLAKHLQRATLSKHGIRSSVSEEEIWSDLGGDRFKHEER